jgi:hypothetical protein
MAFGVFQDFYSAGFLNSYSASDISWVGSIQLFLDLGCGALAGKLCVNIPELNNMTDDEFGLLTIVTIWDIVEPPLFGAQCYLCSGQALSMQAHHD